MERKSKYSEAFNFGPLVHEELTVGQVINKLKGQWDKINFVIKKSNTTFHESELLKLDCTKSQNELLWKPIWSTEEGLERTISWYKSYYDHGKVSTPADLSNFVDQAIKRKAVWTNSD